MKVSIPLSLGIIALSMTQIYSELTLEKELLLNCQETLQLTAETEKLSHRNITGMQAIEQDLLEDLYARDPVEYRYVLNQTLDSHDYLALPETKLEKSAGFSMGSKLETCRKNVDARFRTFTNLQVIFNDTDREIEAIIEQHFPQYLLPPNSKK